MKIGHVIIDSVSTHTSQGSSKDKEAYLGEFDFVKTRHMIMDSISTQSSQAHNDNEQYLRHSDL